MNSPTPVELLQLLNIFIDDDDDDEEEDEEDVDVERTCTGPFAAHSDIQHQFNIV